MRTFDVAVLGAGAAGLMAAIRAAESGARTVLLEKNPKPGVKILASGGGRCNLTTTREGSALLNTFAESQRRFLRPSFRALPPRRLRDWFEARGVALREEAMEKVFPVAGRASVVLEALVTTAQTVGVSLRCGASVQRLEPGWTVVTSDGDIDAERVILAVGGRSYPKAGTTGDGYSIARGLGLAVTPLKPGLVGLRTADQDLSALAGITVDPARVRLFDHATGATRESWDRPVLFTHDGLSGPGPMNLAGSVGQDDSAWLSIDLCPDLDFDAVDRAVIEASKSRRKSIPALLPLRFPERLRRALVARAGIPGDTTAATLPRDARRRLVSLVKGLEVRVLDTLGYDRAEVTVGGVALHEVDPKTMAARCVPGLYVCGEILDVDGPIGGFNFQAAFATGWVAGEAAARERVDPGSG
ncbi:MAG: aminoacetone oxidase family FAD-binding enzyme [Planctomycetes bacterium]|nr:aminoacetone oxidase family FAD-binding enzyme [Planctomycetota bacterium]